jgi:hypothetical protein
MGYLYQGLGIHLSNKVSQPIGTQYVYKLYTNMEMVLTQGFFR